MKLVILFQATPPNPLPSLLILLVITIIIISIVRYHNKKRNHDRRENRLLIEQFIQQSKHNDYSDFNVKKSGIDSTKIEFFIATMSDKFHSDDLLLIRSRLEALDDNRLIMIQSIDYKKPTTILIVSFFLGCFGIDRFILGENLLGILKLITCGGFFVWAIIDCFTALNRTREYNINKFLQFSV